MTTTVYMIAEQDGYGGWEDPDPYDGVWLSEEKAQAHVDEINTNRLENWLTGNDGFVGNLWRFNEKLSQWKAANFDKPENERTPRPEREKRTAENYSHGQDVKVVRFEVQE